LPSFSPAAKKGYGKEKQFTASACDKREEKEVRCVVFRGRAQREEYGRKKKKPPSLSQIERRKKVPGITYCPAARAKGSAKKKESAKLIV